MPDSPESILTDTTFTVERVNDQYRAVADLPVDAPLDELKYQGYHIETVLPELHHGVHLLDQYGDVNADMHERGERAADLAREAPGVLDATYSEPVRELVVTHETMQTDTYSELTLFAGLRESHCWVSHDREHGPVFVVEYDVRPFAPPFPDTATWDDLGGELREKAADECLLDSLRFEHVIALAGEVPAEQALVTHPDVMDGAPRLAGTECNAFHVYTLVAVRGGDPEDVIEHVYPELAVADVEFIVARVAAEYKDEAEEYAKRSVTRRESDEWVPLDELPPFPNESTY